MYHGVKFQRLREHDPGNELYEIKTNSGRKVKVTESKSLLIWNEIGEQFEMMSTPDVKVGKYVPVTETLREAHITKTYIESPYLKERFELTKDNGRMMGKYIATEKIEDKEDKEDKEQKEKYDKFFEKIIGKGQNKNIPKEAYIATREFVRGM